MDDKTTEPFVVRYKNKTYDITRFVKNHPGGSNTLKGLNNKEIDKRFKLVPPHSEMAMYLMKSYEIDGGDLANGKNDFKSDGEDEACNAVNGEKCNGTNGIANGSVNGLNENESIETTKKIDESLESLIDYSKPIIGQIPSLGKNYSAWVNNPVDIPIRLFEAQWMEDYFSRTPWYVVVAYWFPVTLYLLYLGSFQADANQTTFAGKILTYLFGIFIWSFIEYMLHRYILHIEAEKFSVYVMYFHFLTHGVHHKNPFDPGRMVFPPTTASLLGLILYIPFWLLAKNSLILFCGSITGYVIYDVIHVYLHFGSPGLGYVYNLKRYHNQHHFGDWQKSYGTTSRFWDVVFDTKILLKKLNFTMKW